MFLILAQNRTLPTITRKIKPFTTYSQNSCSEANFSIETPCDRCSPPEPSYNFRVLCGPCATNFRQIFFARNFPQQITLGVNGCHAGRLEIWKIQKHSKISSGGRKYERRRMRPLTAYRHTECGPRIHRGRNASSCGPQTRKVRSYRTRAKRPQSHITFDAHTPTDNAKPLLTHVALCSISNIGLNWNWHTDHFAMSSAFNCQQLPRDMPIWAL